MILKSKAFHFQHNSNKKLWALKMKSFWGENPTALNLDPQMGVVVSLGLCQPLIETERGTGGCVHSILALLQ